jgi:hypothetical protein
MVLTDLLLQGAPPAARRFFNVLAEEPDTVAAALVPQIRDIQVCNHSQQLAGCLWCLLLLLGASGLAHNHIAAQL